MRKRSSRLGWLRSLSSPFKRSSQKRAIRGNNPHWRYADLFINPLISVDCSYPFSETLGQVNAGIAQSQGERITGAHLGDDGVR